MPVLPRMSLWHLNGGQRLAVRYFCFALLVFAAQLVFGLLAGIQYVKPGFMYGVVDFSVNRMVHTSAMAVWLLCGLIGSIYWLLEEEAGHHLAGSRLGGWTFWVLVSTVAALAARYALDYTGGDTTLWRIVQARESIRAPRWTDVVIGASMLVFLGNVAGTILRGKCTGIGTVLVLDLLALAGIYVAGTFYRTDIPAGQYWWWVVHLWAEATWEVLVGALLAYALMKTLGVRRRIVETWLYVQVALLLVTGALSLGHHHPSIGTTGTTGTTGYWPGFEGFISVLQPMPLVAMVMHALYESHPRGMRNTNHPALSWLVANAVASLLGAAVWGFMHELPPMDAFAHAPQWAASHRHLAFFGAYATVSIAFFYLAVQKLRGGVWMSAGMPDGGWKWKASFSLLNLGIVGMTAALLVAGYAESTHPSPGSWAAHFGGHGHPWFQQAMWARQFFGWLMLIGFVILAWDLLTAGRRELRAVQPLQAA